MAKFVVCSVADAAVGAFMQPFFARSIGEARRSFGDAVNDPKMEFGKHPRDYELVHLGNWDDSGQLTILDKPEVICRAVDWIVEEVASPVKAGPRPVS